MTTGDFIDLKSISLKSIPLIVFIVMAPEIINIGKSVW